jgi:hypothetical protein
MKLTPIDLGNGILLFKNVFKEPEKVYQFILDSKTNDDPYFGKDIWYDWQPWGNYAKAYPDQSDEYKTSDSYGAELQREGIEIFFSALESYKEYFKDDAFFERHGFPKDYPTSLEELESRLYSGDMRFHMADFVLFETNKNVDANWQMNIHQDTIPYLGVVQNHMFNFNIYINDDYEGGDIIFFKHENVEKVPYTDKVSGNVGEAWLVEDFFQYKMQAGDAMLFPVDLYHGVKPIGPGGTKFYIRQFMSNITIEDLEKTKVEFLSSGKTEEDWQAHLLNARKEALEKRKNPILFNSLDDIVLNSHMDVNKTQVPCVIKSYRDISDIR